MHGIMYESVQIVEHKLNGCTRNGKMMLIETERIIYHFVFVFFWINDYGNEHIHTKWIYNVWTWHIRKAFHWDRQMYHQLLIQA